MFLPSFLPKKGECYMPLVLVQAAPFIVDCSNKMAGHSEFCLTVLCHTVSRKDYNYFQNALKEISQLFGVTLAFDAANL